MLQLMVLTERGNAHWFSTETSFLVWTARKIVNMIIFIQVIKVLSNARNILKEFITQIIIECAFDKEMALILDFIGCTLWAVKLRSIHWSIRVCEYLKVSILKEWALTLNLHYDWQWYRSSFFMKTIFHFQ